MNRDIETLLDRYVKRETSLNEDRLVEKWLDENGNTDPTWQRLDSIAQEKWLADVFNDIRISISKTENKIITMPHRKHMLWKRMAAAAILVISLALYYEWPALQKRSVTTQLTALKVPVHQKRQVILPDGSEVWVNEASELKYPKKFTAKLREVYLSGEAYFDVKHHANQPFIIHTGNLVTTVLGTAFDIREDKNKHTVEVTVTRGKVSVAKGGKLLGVLTPNQQISYNSLNNEAVKQTVDANLAIAWQQNELYFDDVNFGDAVLQLQKQFNVKISFANQKLKTCRFTGTALKGERLDNILKVICAFNNATYQTKPDGSFVIDGPGCN
ncbi:FecR domain-containing protein [Mucilaginibacter sp. UR6-11]|nr:FecR domain-containing protein [Mucilaginibacter sp. UR6-11]